MYEQKINDIAGDVEKFVAAEKENTLKIDNLQQTISKMQRQLLTSETSNPKIFANNDPNQNSPQFSQFIRKGNNTEFITKALSEGENQGDALVNSAISNQIITGIKAKSIMRQLASVEHISTRALEVIIEQGRFNAGWVSETDERATTENPTLVKKTIQTHEIYAQPKATQNLIDDAEIDVEKWLIERLVDNFTKVENEAFFLGNGDNKPEGLLRNTEIKKVDFAATVTVEALLALMNELGEEYLASAHFIMNRKTLSLIQSMQDKEGRFVWRQSLNDPLTQTIFGIPVVCSAQMPDVGADNLAIALGDFHAGYKIVDRHNINIIRDPFTDKPFVRFYATKRVGGAVVNPQAIRLAKFTE